MESLEVIKKLIETLTKIVFVKTGIQSKEDDFVPDLPFMQKIIYSWFKNLFWWCAMEKRPDKQIVPLDEIAEFVRKFDRFAGVSGKPPVLFNVFTHGFVIRIKDCGHKYCAFYNNESIHCSSDLFDLLEKIMKVLTDSVFLEMVTETVVFAIINKDSFRKVVKLSEILEELKKKPYFITYNLEVFEDPECFIEREYYLTIHVNDIKNLDDEIKEKLENLKIKRLHISFQDNGGNYLDV